MARKEKMELGDSLNWRGSVPASAFKGKLFDGKIWLHYRVVFMHRDFTEHVLPGFVGLEPDDSAETVARRVYNSLGRHLKYFEAEVDGSSIEFWLPTGVEMAGHRISGGLFPDGKLISLGEEVEILHGASEAKSLFVSATRQIKSRRSGKRK